MRNLIKLILTFMVAVFCSFLFFAYTNELDLSKFKLEFLDFKKEPTLQTSNNIDYYVVDSKKSVEYIIFDQIYKMNNTVYLNCSIEYENCYNDLVLELDSVNEKKIPYPITGYTIEDDEQLYILKLQFNLEQLNKELLNEQVYVQNKNELIRFIYQYLNHGMTEFMFTCNYDFDTCLQDTNDNIFIIRDFISPLYAFSGYEYTYSSKEKNIKIKIQPKLDLTQQKIIDELTDDIINTIPSDYNLTQKIRYVHDYIVDTSVYDEDCTINQACSDDDSYTMYGLFIKHKAVCEGYADAMHLFLDKFNVPNYRVSSIDHAWNLVYSENEWFSIDATWDDPIGAINDQYKHNYLLITEAEMQLLDCRDEEECEKNSLSHTYNVVEYNMVYEILSKIN